MDLLRQQYQGETRHLRYGPSCMRTAASNAPYTVIAASHVLASRTLSLGSRQRDDVLPESTNNPAPPYPPPRRCAHLVCGPLLCPSVQAAHAAAAKAQGSKQANSSCPCGAEAHALVESVRVHTSCLLNPAYARQICVLVREQTQQTCRCDSVVSNEGLDVRHDAQQLESVIGIWDGFIGSLCGVLASETSEVKRELLVQVKDIALTRRSQLSEMTGNPGACGM